MKNIQKSLFFLFFVLIFSLPIFAQEIVKEPELPSGYEQWPNVLRKEKDLNNNRVLSLYYGRSLSSEWVEALRLLKINNEIIISDYIYFRKNSRNYNHSMGMVFDKGNGYRIIHWAISSGYLQYDSRNFEIPDSEDLEKLSQKEMEELGSKRAEMYRKLEENEKRLVENEEKIKSFGINLQEITNFFW